jgi:hypothetical protein
MTTHDKRILNQMFRLEIRDGLRFHFAILTSGGVRCKFKDKDGKTVHAAEGITEDEAFKNAAGSWNPNKAEDERADLASANADMAKQIEALQQQLEAEKTAVATVPSSDTSQAAVHQPKKTVTKKKKTRRKSESLGL